MTDVRAALTTLGWRVDTSARLRQAVMDFQRGWNLGAQLESDGNPGPKTIAALDISLARRAQGLPDFSEHFNAREFACACGGGYSDCRRIWVIRPTVEACEKYRDLVGPFSPSRGCRCTRQNAAVGGAKNSQHLYGAGVDVPVYAITPTQLAKLRFVSGIGRYSWNGRDYVRHFDCRHASAWNTTGSGLSNPAMWSYGTAKSAPLTPRPDLANKAPAQPTPAPSQEDELMALMIPHPDTGELVPASSALWSMWTYALKASRAADANLSLTKAQAAAGRPLTADEIKQAVAEALKADYDAEITLTPKDSQ